jgi:N-acyl-D-amino-acid deacylase
VAQSKFRHLEGKFLGEAAQIVKGKSDEQTIGDLICELLLASDMAVGCVVPHLRRGEEDVQALIRHPAMMAGSDGIFTGSRPHPRGCGCFARYLGPYVRDTKTWSLEQAVQHLAAHAAKRFGLRDRGLLKEGMAADVVVFDPNTIADRSTYEDGKQLAIGMEHVFVNGQAVLSHGQRTKALPGQGLKRS